MTADPWEEVDDLLRELSWYASRKKDLAAPLLTDPSRTFADMMAEEQQELEVAIQRARNQS
jgi:hypothetical protein